MKLSKKQKETMKKHLYTNTIDKKKNTIDNPFDSRSLNHDNEKKLSQWYREIEICQSYQDKYDIDK